MKIKLKKWQYMLLVVLATGIMIAFLTVIPYLVGITICKEDSIWIGYWFMGLMVVILAGLIIAFIWVVILMITCGVRIAIYNFVEVDETFETEVDKDNREIGKLSVVKHEGDIIDHEFT